MVSKLSGFYEFADEPESLRTMWTRVSLVEGMVRQLRIHVGWDLQAILRQGLLSNASWRENGAQSVRAQFGLIVSGE